MAKKELPEINASSLADIAFLLLTFFLIATSMDKREGITKKIPDPTYQAPPTPKQPQNVLEINMNALASEVLIEGNRAQLGTIKSEVKKHVLNNGDGSCDYCVGGIGSPNYSNNPSQALILVKTLQGTPFKTYTTVQNEIDKAFNEIWDEYAKRTYSMSMEQLREAVKDKENQQAAADAQAKIEDITTVKFKKVVGDPPPENQQ